MVSLSNHEQGRVEVALSLPGPQRLGRFLRRVNRFAVEVEVEVDGEPMMAHLPNSGRMTELLVAGHPALLIARPGPARKTAYDMALVQYRGIWVSVDSRLPSALAYEALRQRALPPWATYTQVRREAAYRDSRLDLELWDGQRRCLVETKSVNLVCNGRALFPDAPTARGARHLRTLTQAVSEGISAGVLFIVQREDATSLSPYDDADPEFGQALREAARAGVAVHAYRCSVSPERIALDGPVPVEL
ncbi:MAG: DNA/RNA nuclease SfsA [Chloroflexi bacterium]|nr:DNA/RNA nuclease SfsA [Chloroflexota bacterium]